MSELASLCGLSVGNLTVFKGSGLESALQIRDVFFNPRSRQISSNISVEEKFSKLSYINAFFRRILSPSNNLLINLFMFGSITDVSCTYIGMPLAVVVIIHLSVFRVNRKDLWTSYLRNIIPPRSHVNNAPVSIAVYVEVVVHPSKKRRKEMSQCSDYFEYRKSFLPHPS